VPILPSAPFAPGAILAVCVPVLAATVTAPTMPVPLSVPAAVAELFTFTEPKLESAAPVPLIESVPAFTLVSPV
jgi:hypothetical protein